MPKEGIAGQLPEETMTDLPIFNPPGTWMDRIAPELLMRFWKKKGCPGRLVLYTGYGMELTYENTPLGLFARSIDTTLEQQASRFERFTAPWQKIHP